MSTAQQFLEHSHRQLINRIAWSVIGSGLGVIIVCGFLLVFSPTIGIVIYGACVLFPVIGGGIALQLLRGRPLWQATLVLAVTQTISLIGAGLIFYQLALLAAIYLLFPVLFVSLSANFRLALGAAILASLLSVGIVIAPTLPGLGFDLGATLPVIVALSVGLFPFLAWVIIERMIFIQTRALAIADHQAKEAEAARAKSDAARIELEQRNAEQKRLLDLVQTLELPVIPIGKGVLATPIVGNLDSRRIAAIQDLLLQSVARERSHTVILDVTGIMTLDSAVAQALLQTAQAIRLLGAQTMLSGIRPGVAQALVELGVKLDDLHPVSDLSQALMMAGQISQPTHSVVKPFHAM
ncbi:MAG: STAS domain-containing protein [Chloroflexales bacterium]|nr:STAS domain-containing protein [Chloroflexales bacterium]